MTDLSSKRTVDQRTSVRRALSWALVAGLCIAAFTAIVAILSGDFDETDGRVIATSLGFAVFSATAASGATLRFRESENLRSLGLVTVALSAVSFLLLPAALWSHGDDDAWRWFGCFAVATLACSHASLVAGAARASDGPAVGLIGLTAIALGILDSFFGILAISGAVAEPGEGFGRLMAVLVVLLVLTTALGPILRRLQRHDMTAAAQPSGAAATAGAGHPSDHPAPSRSLAAELLAAADRIEELNGDPGNRAPEIRRECQRLRELARANSR